MTDTTDFPSDDFDATGTGNSTGANPGWLSPLQLAQVRDLIPLVYVNALPVRLNELGEVTEVGLLLQVGLQGTITRALVSGRVLFKERIKEALLRHLEKDLGPMALPRIPASIQPFTVAEYFPNKGVTDFYDYRQHAVSLAYIVPVSGDCHPRRDALEITWLTPTEASAPEILADLEGGQDKLLLQALAHLGKI